MTITIAAISMVVSILIWHKAVVAAMAVVTITIAPMAIGVVTWAYIAPIGRTIVITANVDVMRTVNLTPHMRWVEMNHIRAMAWEGLWARVTVTVSVVAPLVAIPISITAAIANIVVVMATIIVVIIGGAHAAVWPVFGHRDAEVFGSRSVARIVTRVVTRVVTLGRCGVCRNTQTESEGSSGDHSRGGIQNSHVNLQCVPVDAGAL